MVMGKIEVENAFSKKTSFLRKLNEGSCVIVMLWGYALAWVGRREGGHEFNRDIYPGVDLQILLLLLELAKIPKKYIP